MRKAIALIGAGAMLLSLVVPVLAHRGSKDVAIIKGNDVTAVANTGGNSQSNVGMAAVGSANVSGTGDRYLSTGDADARALGVVVANTHVSCDGYAGGGRSHKDIAVVKRNDVWAEANTGANAQDNSGQAVLGSVTVSGNGNRTAYTGSATARAAGFVVVNTHLSL